MTEHRFTRRRALGALGTVSLGALLSACGGGRDDAGAPVTSAEVETSAGTATVSPQTTVAAAAELFEGAASCILTPEQTEGPFYFDVDSIRSDLREDRPGTTLRLALRIQDAAGCTPLPNSVVEIWHCDAGGVYSGFESASQGRGGGGLGGSGPTDAQTYLRGAQVTNPEGIVEFVTVYPGWYRGRTVHVHAKVHLDSATLLTTQLYFDEAVTEQVYRDPPYRDRPGRDTFNDDDGIFSDQTVLSLSPQADGLLGVITIGVASP